MEVNLNAQSLGISTAPARHPPTVSHYNTLQQACAVLMPLTDPQVPFLLSSVAK